MHESDILAYYASIGAMNCAFASLYEIMTRLVGPMNENAVLTGYQFSTHSGSLLPRGCPVEPQDCGRDRSNEQADATVCRFSVWIQV